MKRFETIVPASRFCQFDNYNMYARINNELQSSSHFPVIMLEDVRKFYILDSVHLDEIVEIKEEWLQNQIRTDGAVVGYIDNVSISSDGACCYSCCALDKNDVHTDVGTDFKRMREVILKEVQNSIPNGSKGFMIAGVINMIKQGYAPDYYFAYDGSYPIKVYVSTTKILSVGERVIIKFSKEERGVVAIHNGEIIGRLYPVLSQRVLFMLDEETLSFEGKVCDITKHGVNVISDILSSSQIERARKDMKEYQKSKK